MKTETTTLYTYIADDGTRFDSLEKCREYEERMNMDALEDEVLSKSVWISNGEYSGLGAYIGAAGDVRILKVDEKTLELANKRGWWDPYLLKVGELGVISIYEDETYVEGSVDDIIDGLKQEIEMLNKLKEENK